MLAAHPQLASTPNKGTSTGLVHVVGSPAFQCTLYLSTTPQAITPGVKFLTFHPGESRLICIDVKDTLHVWNLGPGGMDDYKNLPRKDVTVSLYGNVTKFSQFYLLQVFATTTNENVLCITAGLSTYLLRHIPTCDHLEQ